MGDGNSENFSTECLELIDRELVLRYCQERGIRGVSHMLEGFTENGITEFINYLSERGVSNLNNELGNEGVLLHGSSELIQTFEPRVSTGGGNSNKNEALVYATDDAEYSIFMGIVRQRGGTYGISYNRDSVFTCYIDLTFINSPSTMEPGYVYIFDTSNFSKVSNHEFTSPKEEVPIIAIPVYPKDLLTTITVKPTYTEK